MAELMRFRQARAPQRRVPEKDTLLDLAAIYDLPRDNMNTLHDYAKSKSSKHSATIPYQAVLSGNETLEQNLIKAASSASGLLELDRWLAGLAASANTDISPSLSELKAKIDACLGAFLPPNDTADWNTLRRYLVELYYVLLIAHSQQPGPSSAEDLTRLTRLLLVVGLVADMASNPSPIRTPGDIWQALQWRAIVLPDLITSILKGIFSKRSAHVVRKPGFADLYLTREEWDHYEAAEIAAIENVLGGELKNHVHILVNETKTETITDTTKTTTNTQDTTTTDQAQLQQQSRADVSLTAHLEGSVDTSGQYGPTKVNTHIGGSLDYSSATSDSKATTQSHEVVSRAVNSVVQSTRMIRSVSVTSRDENKEIHKFDNTSHTTPIVGIYRWVDQVQNVELDRYPHRFLLEFELPEPGAWTRWLHWDDVDHAMLNTLPAKFVNSSGAPLQPGDITPTSYGEYVAKYGAMGVSPPPGKQYISASIKRDMPAAEYGSNNPDWKQQPVYVASDTSATLPSGYRATGWTASVEAWSWGSESNDLRIAVGSGLYQSVHTTPGGSIDQTLHGEVSSSPIASGVSVGNVPITIMTLHIWGFVANIEIECAPTEDTLNAWQANTYDQLLGAYNTLLQAYKSEKAGLEVSVTNIVDAKSPEQNAQHIRQELKRQVIEMLTGKPFRGIPDAINWDSTGVTPPTTDLAVAVAVAPEIQFLEQAFEWETLSYIFYPYYWADASRWKELASIDGNDQQFADFLRAGSARVVLAARPGYEHQVNLFTTLGILWGGGPAPAPNNPEYLSIADEIRAQQQRPLDVTVVDSWQVRLPTTLVWLENPVELPVNQNPTIIPRPHIITVIPNAGPVGSTLTILGECFGASQADSTVTVGGVLTTPTRWGRTAIELEVPAGAATGAITVAANGINSNPAAFTVV